MSCRDVTPPFDAIDAIDGEPGGDDDVALCERLTGLGSTNPVNLGDNSFGTNTCDSGKGPDCGLQLEMSFALRSDIVMGEAPVTDAFFDAITAVVAKVNADGP